MDFELLSFQKVHAANIVEILKKNSVALDASSTGTGKTFVALYAVLHFAACAFIVCPKSVIPSWQDAARMVGVKLVGIASYESLKRGKGYFPTKATSVVDWRTGTCACPFVKHEAESEIIPALASQKKKQKVPRFQLPQRTFVILDEAHRAKHTSSGVCALMMSLVDAVRRGKQCRGLLLSATLADRLNYFAPFGAVLNLYPEPKHFKAWLSRQRSQGAFAQSSHGHGAAGTSSSTSTGEHDAVKVDASGALRLVTSINQAKSIDETHSILAINRAIYPALASRMRIADLGDAFPRNKVIAEGYMLDAARMAEVDAAYEAVRHINARLGQLKTREEVAEGLAKLVRAMQHVELLKAPIFVELIQDALESNCSVAVFVKFLATLDEIAGALACTCVIQGKQSLEERAAHIAAFQANEQHLILCQFAAAGTGVSLHDLHGRPRISLLSPTYNAVDLLQALGRIHRAGAQTPALQKIVFVSGTIEDSIKENFKSKISSLNTLNDADVRPFELAETVVVDIERAIDTKL